MGEQRNSFYRGGQGPYDGASKIAYLPAKK